MTILITGAAGFIGSNLSRRLLERGHRIAGIDNLCRGTLCNLGDLLKNSKFSFEIAEISDLNVYYAAVRHFHEIEAITEVWHLAANSDISAGTADADIDLRDTFMTTFNTLKVMKELDIRRLIFASSSAVYGDLKEIHLHEDIGPLFPISNYGAMKLASESAISVALEAWLERAWICRFPNVIGTPATHGALLDFVRKLKRTPHNLDVLGNGSQQKTYLHVDELIDAMLFIHEHALERLAYYNIGAEDEGVTVRFMAEQVIESISPRASISFGEGDKGWIGDVPKFVYTLDKLRNLGWRPRLGSSEAVKLAVQQIVQQETSE